MKLIYPSVELLEQSFDLNDIYSQIEIAARTCYKSEGNKGKEFVDKLIENKHTAMLEHGTVYLTIIMGHSLKDRDYGHKIYLYHKLLDDPYTKVRCKEYTVQSCPKEFVESAKELIKDSPFSTFSIAFITTNLRVLLENFPDNYQDILRKFGSNSDYHILRKSVRIICDRGVSHELVRHRKFSFAQESTRYCNYSKDKFGNEITYIIPTWINDYEEYQENYGLPMEGVVIRPPFEDKHLMSEYTFFYALFYAEENYFRLLDLGWTPQEARQVLPNALKTEIVMTGFIDDWKYFLDVRTTNTYGVPHPDMRNIALMIKDTLHL